MKPRSLCLTPAEAELAARHELTTLVREVKPRPPTHDKWGNKVPDDIELNEAHPGIWTMTSKNIGPDVAASLTPHSARPDVVEYWRELSPFGSPGDRIEVRDTYYHMPGGSEWMMEVVADRVIQLSGLTEKMAAGWVARFKDFGRQMFGPEGTGQQWPGWYWKGEPGRHEECLSTARSAALNYWDAHHKLGLRYDQNPWVWVAEVQEVRPWKCVNRIRPAGKPRCECTACDDPGLNPGETCRTCGRPR
jgi:hypothetical protein